MTSLPQLRPSTASSCVRVLGIDPAVSGTTGYGVVEVNGSAQRLLRFGGLKLSTRTPLDDRLRQIYSLIASLLEEFSPDAVAVESVFTALNMRTALKLAEVRGVVLLAAAQARVPAYSYSPREVKANITGFGAASKQQMQHMIRSLLGLVTAPEPADAADALAIALCHAQAARSRARIAKATAMRASGNSPGSRVGTGRISLPADV